MIGQSESCQSENLSSTSSESGGATDSRPGATGRRAKSPARSGSEGGASRSADQNCRSIDSHMSRLRLPGYLRDLGHLEIEVGITSPDYTSPASKGKKTPSGHSMSGTEGEAGSPPLSQRAHRQRQMSLFNMSVCFARCGYIDSAV